MNDDWKTAENKGLVESTAIVGAGPSGLATAIMLARRGWNNITVYDRLGEPEPPSSSFWGNPDRSYNIGIGGRGQKALTSFGVWERVEKYSAQVNARQDWSPGSEEPVFTDLSHRTYKTKVIQRDRLTSVLYEEVLEKYSDQVNVVFDATCEDVIWPINPKAPVLLKLKQKIKEPKKEPDVPDMPEPVVTLSYWEKDLPETIKEKENIEPTALEYDVPGMAESDTVEATNIIKEEEKSETITATNTKLDLISETQKEIEKRFDEAISKIKAIPKKSAKAIQEKLSDTTAETIASPPMITDATKQQETDVPDKLEPIAVVTTKAELPEDKIAEELYEPLSLVSETKKVKELEELYEPLPLMPETKKVKELYAPYPLAALAPGKKKMFAVAQMFPDDSEQSLGKSIANFFGGISVSEEIKERGRVEESPKTPSDITGTIAEKRSDTIKDTEESTVDGIGSPDQLKMSSQEIVDSKTEEKIKSTDEEISSPDKLKMTVQEIADSVDEEKTDVIVEGKEESTGDELGSLEKLKMNSQEMDDEPTVDELTTEEKTESTDDEIGSLEKLKMSSQKMDDSSIDNKTESIDGDESDASDKLNMSQEETVDSKTPEQNYNPRLSLLLKENNLAIDGDESDASDKLNMSQEETVDSKTLEQKSIPSLSFLLKENNLDTDETSKSQEEESLIVETDFVIGADGVRSAVRTSMENDLEFSKQNGFKTVEYPPRNTRVYKTIPMKFPNSWRKDINYSARTKSGVNIDALPTLDGVHVGVVLFKPETTLVTDLKSGKEAKTFFKETFPQFADFIADEDFDKFITKPVSRLPEFSYAKSVLNREDSCVLVGDTIHTVKPYFGLGVNSAFEDIAVLNTCLDENNDDLRKSLDSYSKKRAKEAKILVELSHTLDGGFLSFILPLILDGISNKIAPKIFGPNVIRMLQREDLNFVQVRRKKRIDRLMQISVLGTILVLAARGGIPLVSLLKNTILKRFFR